MNYKDVFQLAQEKGYKPRFGIMYAPKEGKELPEGIIVLVLLECTLIQKWLRDNHKIFVRIDFTYDIKTVESYSDLNKVYPTRWAYYVDRPMNREHWNKLFHYDTYEEALLEGIYEALKLIA